uniref:Uncharacterized protein n=1 Tax=Trypanosoma congolense (strain IL3000) TaxID=1068625 RepID=G0USD9_TRYCI|nr:hypothetical protein, unlikely [Trypanosoma congolense IL3000]
MLTCYLNSNRVHHFPHRYQNIYIYIVHHRLLTLYSITRINLVKGSKRVVSMKPCGTECGLTASAITQCYHILAYQKKQFFPIHHQGVGIHGEKKRVSKQLICNI